MHLKVMLYLNANDNSSDYGNIPYNTLSVPVQLGNLTGFIAPVVSKEIETVVLDSVRALVCVALFRGQKHRTTRPH